jgi:hypothetical protein
VVQEAEATARALRLRLVERDAQVTDLTARLTQSQTALERLQRTVAVLQAVRRSSSSLHQPIL